MVPKRNWFGVELVVLLLLRQQIVLSDTVTRHIIFIACDKGSHDASIPKLHEFGYVQNALGPLG